MKSYLPIIASLFLLSTSCSSTVAQVETEKVTQATEITTQEKEAIATEINPYIKDNIAPEISVKINGAENGGSGVIIAQEDNTYLVLTNNHVLRSGDEFTIDTHDGVTHQATEVENGIDTDDDLALLQFISDKEYQTATINTAATPKEEQAILAVGYSAEGELVTEAGKIERIPDKTLSEGYSIGYTSNIVQGMSGGAILNSDGEVIGINGKSAFPIVNTGYSNEDGTEPSAEEIEELRQLSWGLSINRLLAQVNQEIITAYNLPLPETTDSIEGDSLTGWLGELEDKAKQISVRIDSSSEANGSGVIVAKESNTYTVLTADHVLCEKDDDRKCIDYTYEIVAPDGKKYPVNIETVKRQEGVDLAVVRFDSDEQYEIAELANYPVINRNAVFVAGYPQLNKNTPAQWLFSLGVGFDREQGLIRVNDNSLSTDSSGLISSQGSLSGGYEMVYTNITYGGMSGGAVLDLDGRVIGIHGLAEGQTALNNQGSSVKQIQLGYSLGVPIQTFAELANRFEINASLPIQDNRPKELNSAEITAFKEALLGTKILRGNTSAETWLERGNKLWRLGLYSEAAEAFEQAIALNPEFIYLAYFGKSLALEAVPEYEAALASLELTTKNQPNFMPAYINKSSILQELNRLDEALGAVEKAILLKKDIANSHNQKGSILLELKQLNKALVAFSLAIEMSPRSIFYSNRGLVYYNQGKLELAFADYNRAIETNPNDANAYSNRGLVYRKQGKLELALADYNSALKLNPQFAHAYNNRGLIYQKQGKLELTLNDLNRALELDPQYVNAYSNRGLIYQKQGKLELALADYNHALKLDPNDADAYGNRGYIYQEQGKLELALADYNHALKLDPNDADAYGNRGYIYHEQGKLELALANYNRAIKLGLQFAQVYNNRGIIYKEQGEPELALADFNQSIEINPDLAEAYSNLGRLYERMGNIEEARSNIEKAQQLFVAQGNTAGGRQTANVLQELSEQEQPKPVATSQPSLQTADEYYDRAFKHHQQQEYDLALADYSKVIELDPSNEKAFINRGLIYQSQGKDESAIADYNRAIAINPNNSAAYRNRGVLYFEQSEYELAEADWDKAVEVNPEDAQAYYNRGLLYQELEEYSSAESDLSTAQRLATLQDKTDLTAKAANVLEQLP